MLARLLLPLLLAAAPPPGRTLQRAIALFQSFEDEKAARLLREVLARSPSGALAAKAHTYLGLIALNAIDPDLARLEFRLAIQANPAAELPLDASPKAHLAFDQARNALARRTEREAAAVPAAPVQATSPPLETVQPAPPRSHAWGWLLVATAVACAAVTAYGIYDVASYDATKSKGSYDTLKPAYDQALAWSYVWPVGAVLTGAAGVGGGFAW